MSAGRRLATLDGLRGIAVLLVVGDHTIGAFTDEEAGVPRLLSAVSSGAVGVTLFFVLSGYLITGILTRERARTGRVDFGAFYLRRTLRILPAFYVFLTVVALLGVAGAVDVSGAQLLSAGLFVWDYSPAADGWWLGHTWSLAIEEQFYLLWPLALAFLRPQRAVWIAVAYLVAAPAIRLGNYVLVESARDDVWMMFHARADALLLGCLLALLPTAYPAAWARLRGLAGARATVPLALVAIVGSSLLSKRFGGYWELPFGLTVVTLGGGVLLLVAVTRETPSVFTRVLRWRVLTAVGLISYSLYLWQQLFLAPEDIALPVVGTTPLAVPAAFAAATLSYLLVERPFLRLKDRLSRSSAIPPGATAGTSAPDAVPADAVPADRAPAVPATADGAPPAVDGSTSPVR
ncbi:acyltransferase family protein [Geodermatophilus nigrescens]|uniref:Peptidoglycan/LPS O-acetylase OafA/YrhL, contains acyltransferase and SGNH-hydrolase domains n=1 Tax=Geodermatophilus nigrescens TaxID=1070870 RepID=A0A1M5D6Q1_9ACTN|nr:acyltransferase [Geodermatophilus nigrescens]SHF62547.1 Peptidoglycan/LPS O-acetylase OafA/YrhL, contains acyltransferase and SGNH-hydrolase domains [Geodermatophilus nigrescens]